MTRGCVSCVNLGSDLSIMGGTVGANGGRVMTFYVTKTSRVTINLCSALGVMVLSSKDKTTVATVM